MPANAICSKEEDVTDYRRGYIFSITVLRESNFRRTVCLFVNKQIGYVEKFRSPTRQRSETHQNESSTRYKYLLFKSRERESKQYAFAYITWQSVLESQPAKNWFNR